MSGERWIDFSGVPMEPELNLDECGVAIIDDGVRELVKVLHDFGYKTVCSCGGHLHELEAYPWVVIIPDEGDFSNVNSLIRALGRFNGKKCREQAPKATEFWSLNPLVLNGTLALYLSPSDLNLDRSFDRMVELCLDGEKLAAFLRNKCGDIFCR